MLFNKIKDQDFEMVKNIQSKTQYNGSEWSKLYLKVWDFFNYETAEFAIENDIAFIRFKTQQKFKKWIKEDTLYLPPMCDISKVKDAINMAREQAKADNEAFAMLGVPQEYIDVLGECDLSVTNLETQAEYLYSTQDLIELKGKKYHSKRNHVAAFDKKYAYTFREYTDADRCAVEKLLLKWEGTQDQEYMNQDRESEEIAIRMSLDMAKEDNIYAYVLYVGDNLVGFTLGEMTPSKVGIVHIEKADIDYDGAYPKLANLFVKEVLKDARIINRQEDMGDEGLRKSKLSFRPIGYAMKYFLN